MMNAITQLSAAQLRRAADIKERLEQLQAELAATLGMVQNQAKPTKTKANGADVQIDEPTFGEAVAMATQNGNKPLTRDELILALPQTGYTGKVDKVTLGGRLYQSPVKRNNGRFWAKI